jgi:hypothetical protein
MKPITIELGDLLWEKKHILNDGCYKRREPHDTSNCDHQKTALNDELPTVTEKIPPTKHLRVFDVKIL